MSASERTAAAVRRWHEAVASGDPDLGAAMELARLHAALAATE